MITLENMKKLITLANQIGISYDYHPFYDNDKIIGHCLAFGNYKLETYETDKDDEEYNKTKKVSKNA